MQIQPVDLTSLVATVLGISIVLIPVSIMVFISISLLAPCRFT